MKITSLTNDLLQNKYSLIFLPSLKYHIPISLCALDKAIEKSKEDVQRVLERQKKTREAQTLLRFENKQQELEQEVNREIQELDMMSQNCEADAAKIGKLKNEPYTLRTINLETLYSEMLCLTPLITEVLQEAGNRGIPPATPQVISDFFSN